VSLPVRIVAGFGCRATPADTSLRHIAVRWLRETTAVLAGLQFPEGDDSRVTPCCLFGGILP